MHKLFSDIRAKSRHPFKLLVGISIIQTRLIVALTVFFLAKFTTAFRNSALISGMMLAYIVLIFFLALLSRTVLERSRLRAIRDLFDVLAIAFLVKSTGGSESPWFLIYLFPIMSAVRYVGTAWSLTIAAFSSLTYAYAAGVFAQGIAQSGYSFWFRAVIFEGVALTAANLVRTRDREEARLVRAIEEIDREILSGADPARIMDSILTTAMEVTWSDVSVLILAGAAQVTRTFVSARDIPSGSERDALELFGKHYDQVLESRRPLALPQRRAFILAITGFTARDNVAHWPARLVPLEIDGAPFGVLGVFSCRKLRQYTSDDVRRLKSIAPLVAMAQKNAELYREHASRDTENKERLQMLYEIAGQLKAERGLEQLFQNVVKLVLTRLRSEEAALFIPDDAGTLEKVAVWGPDDETIERLRTIERSYKRSEPSLNRRVFDNKTQLLENRIPQSEVHAETYSALLPSGETRHYMGVPLLIGEEVLGVIRVLNKKTENYSPESAILDGKGFTEDDLQLLTMIATQIASAIRNAKFIERNRYFENLVYNSPDLIVVVDKAGNIQNFNHECEKLWGKSEKDVLGTPVADYYESPATARTISKALWEAERHTIHNYEARIKDAGGNVIPIRLSGTLLLDKFGAQAGSIAVFKDQREILRLEEEKVRAEKLAAVGRLAHTTGHDIKHDLGIIMNYAEALQRKPADSAIQKVYSAIRDAANGALNKLQNMLMTAKPRPPEKQIVSLRLILAEFEASIGNRMLASNTKFCITYPECDPVILADSSQMRQVLANLLGNSLDAIKLARLSPDKESAGKIDLVVEMLEEDVVLFWRDDGFGMSDEARNKAFTPFFTTKDTGSGLGLFIIKTIIENHDGHITLESASGSGICFRIALPLALP